MQSFVPVIALIVCAVAIVGALQRKTIGRARYDERQAGARLAAYRGAYWTLAGYLAVSALYGAVAGRWPVYPAISALIGICLSMGVFSVMCIYSDAYVAPGDRPGRYVVVLAIALAVNAAAFISTLVKGETFVTDGMLNGNCASIVTALLFAVVLAASLIRARRANAREDA